jgi:hypothetical protein
MKFLEKLFRRKEVPALAPLPQGIEPTQGEQDASRKIMEAQVAADRTRRGATDVRPKADRPG